MGRTFTQENHASSSFLTSSTIGGQTLALNCFWLQTTVRREIDSSVRAAFYQQPEVNSSACFVKKSPYC